MAQSKRGGAADRDRKGDSFGPGDIKEMFGIPSKPTPPSSGGPVLLPQTQTPLPPPPPPPTTGGRPDVVRWPEEDPVGSIESGPEGPTYVPRPEAPPPPPPPGTNTGGAGPLPPPAPSSTDAGGSETDGPLDLPMLPLPPPPPVGDEPTPPPFVLPGTPGAVPYRSPQFRWQRGVHPSGPGVPVTGGLGTEPEFDDDFVRRIVAGLPGGRM